MRAYVGLVVPVRIRVPRGIRVILGQLERLEQRTERVLRVPLDREASRVFRVQLAIGGLLVTWVR